MRFTVEGADANTGKERVLSVEANDEAQAELLARNKGLLVSAVHASTVGNDPDILNELAGAAQLRSHRSNTAQPARTVNYSAVQAKPAPDYLGLRLGALVLRIVSGVYYVCAGVFAILGVIIFVGIVGSALGASGGRGGKAEVLVGSFAIGGFGALIFLIVALVAASVGALYHAAAAGCLALRDIARNSFAR